MEITFTPNALKALITVKPDRNIPTLHHVAVMDGVMVATDKYSLVAWVPKVDLEVCNHSTHADFLIGFDAVKQIINYLKGKVAPNRSYTLHVDMENMVLTDPIHNQFVAPITSANDYSYPPVPKLFSARDLLDAADMSESGLSPRTMETALKIMKLLKVDAFRFRNSKKGGPLQNTFYDAGGKIELLTMPVRAL